MKLVCNWYSGIFRLPNIINAKQHSSATLACLTTRGCLWVSWTHLPHSSGYSISYTLSTASKHPLNTLKASSCFPENSRRKRYWALSEQTVWVLNCRNVGFFINSRTYVGKRVIPGGLAVSNKSLSVIQRRRTFGDCNANGFILWNVRRAWNVFAYLFKNVFFSASSH